MTYEKEFNQFLSLLKKEDKEQSVLYALSLLESKKVEIEELYKIFLAPSLMYFECDVDDVEICIWKEHHRTSIIRTILESSYAYIVKRKESIQSLHKKVVVLTPSFEYHEIAAIMVSHFMLLQGFDSSYIGANVPKADIISALRSYQPDYIAFSVTNPYNIVVTEQVCAEIKRFFPEVKIILGGQAFKNQAALPKIKYDYLLDNFDDIKKFADEVKA
ncbi:MAG: cobalamin B12-binding domain-containing protein [Acholeplasmataceae bacterium]|nr:cobalamin B12-binding domain-containing protein [Acholeplasmataceae bacterium]